MMPVDRIGHQWCLALTALIFGIVLSNSVAGNVATQHDQHLLLIANHGDQLRSS